MGFQGSPVPKVAWLKNGEPLAENERVKFDLKPQEADFVAQNASLKDSGVYTCVLKNDLGQDKVSINVVVLDKPSQPQGPIEASEITADGCTLTWKPPKDDGNSPITNYVIEKFDPKKNEWQKVSSYCRQPTYEVIGLEEGKPYKFRVFAENAEGKSIPLETESTVTPKNPCVLPPAPSGLTVGSQTSSTVQLEWNPVIADGLNKTAGYNVEMCEPGSDDWYAVNDLLVRTPFFEVTGLKPGKDYKFRVKAKNAAGWGPASKQDVNAILKPEFVKSDAPGMPTIKKVGNKFVDLEWTAPIKDGGSKLLGYVVEKKQAGTEFWVKANAYTVPETECRIDDLIENAVYEFRVRALNKAGESEPSSSTGLQKISEYPDGVKPELTRKPVDTEAPIGGSVSFHVEFEGSPEPVATWFRNGLEISGGNKFIVVQDKLSSTLTINKLYESDNLAITCVVANPLGKISCDASLRIKPAPKLEKELDDQTVVFGENLKVKLPIIGKGPFSFKLKKDGEEMPMSNKIKVNECDGIVSLVLPNADNDDSGRYELVISNDSGSVNAPFKVKVKSPPGAPTGPLTVSNVGKHECTLTWKSPKEDGGSKVTHYLIEKRDCSKGKDAWVPYADHCREHSIAVQGLKENGEYEFRVMAVNQNGMSEPLVTAHSVVAKLPFGVPGAPGAPDVQEIGSDFVSLSWAKPATDGGGPLVGYYVEKKEKSSDKWIRCNLHPTQTTAFNVPNLIENKEYEFRVFAENEAGLGEPSMGSRQVLVRDPNAATSPEFTLRLANTEASEGRTAYFECHIAASPNTDVRFYKGDKEIFSGSKYHISNDGDKYTLAVHNVTHEDEDEFSVKAKNKSGSKMSRASLTVRSAPKIKLPERFKQPVLFDKEELIVVKIPYTANPLPSCKWFKNNEEINKSTASLSTSPYEVELSAHYATIRIRNATSAHSGVYKLRLDNSLGADSCEFNIQIADVPGSPRFLVVENIQDESVTMSWKPPSSDGGSSITNYIVERLDLSDGQWTRCSRTRLTHFTDEFLKPLSKYQYRVVAENSQGHSLPCEPTAVLTTLESEISKRRKKWLDFDENGKRRRGIEGQAPSDYDKCVHDPWARSGRPAPADYRLGSVYDYYDIYEELGSGAFGVVHRAVEKSSGRSFAAKFIATPSVSEKASVRRECDMMNHLIHQRLLNLHDVFDEGDEMCLITEFLSGGELFEKIASPSYRMTEYEAKRYIRQVCEGLQHMHENNIVHLDIKPENIMFESKSSNNVKIVDFSLATRLDPDEVVKISAANCEFAAPEIVEKEAVGFATDMWAVGVLTYVILSGISPFGGVDELETAVNIVDCNVSFSSEFDVITSNGKDFIKKLLLRNKGARMNVFEALEHPWLNMEDMTGAALSSHKYDYISQKIRAKYSAWPEPNPSIGRLANFSSLRTHRPKEYNIYSSYFDRRDAAPRFVRKPRNQYVVEGQNAEFHCIIIAASPPLVSWHVNGSEIKQSVKHMKKYLNNSYRLEIKRCDMDDKGEYIVKAVNSYGEREYNPYLNVEREFCFSYLYI